MRRDWILPFSIKKGMLVLSTPVCTSIIVPAHNEETQLESLIEAVLAATTQMDSELIVVNDNSSDATGEIADTLFERYSEVHVVHRTSNNSFGGALKEGIDNATGEFVVPVMADLCDDVATIPNMVAVAERTGVDFVVGSRYIMGGGTINQPLFKGFLSRYYSRLYSFVSGRRITDITNAFKCYRRDVLDGLSIESDWFDISVELPSRIIFEKDGHFREVPTTWTGRAVGSSKFNVLHMGRRYFRWLAYAARKRLMRG